MPPLWKISNSVIYLNPGRANSDIFIKISADSHVVEIPSPGSHIVMLKFPTATTPMIKHDQAQLNGNWKDRRRLAYKWRSAAKKNFRSYSRSVAAGTVSQSDKQGRICPPVVIFSRRGFVRCCRVIISESQGTLAYQKRDSTKRLVRISIIQAYARYEQ